LLLFEVSSMQAPLHFVNPGLQSNPHAFMEQVGWEPVTFDVHVIPHPPQLPALLVVSTHVVPHNVGVPDGQPDTHE
jgi:hypothetical protein